MKEEGQEERQEERRGGHLSEFNLPPQLQHKCDQWRCTVGLLALML